MDAEVVCGGGCSICGCGDCGCDVISNDWDVEKVVVIEALGLVKRAGGRKVAAVTTMVVMSVAAKLEAMRLLAAAANLQVRVCF